MAGSAFERLGLQVESHRWLRLDVLRLVAAGAIVWHHSHALFYPLSQRPQVTAQTSDLWLFVILFFIISGVIIAATYGERVGSRAQIGVFFRRRVARLVPLHLLMLGLLWIMWQAVFALDVQTSSAPDMRPVCIANNVFLLNGLIRCGAGYGLNEVSWSISIEMALYALFPLFVVVRRYLGGLESLFLATLAMRLILPIESLDHVVRASLLLEGVAAFLFGMLLFSHAPRLANIIPGAGLMLWPAVIGLFVTAVQDWPVAYTWLLVYTVAVLAVAADSRQVATGWVGRMAPLGQLTYGIYMWHTMIIAVVLNGIALKWLDLSGAPLIAVALATYGAVVVISYASWRWFERPMRDAIGGVYARPIAAIGTTGLSDPSERTTSHAPVA